MMESSDVPPVLLAPVPPHAMVTVKGAGPFRVLCYDCDPPQIGIAWDPDEASDMASEHHGDMARRAR